MTLWGLFVAEKLGDAKKWTIIPVADDVVRMTMQLRYDSFRFAYLLMEIGSTVESHWTAL